MRAFKRGLCFALLLSLMLLCACGTQEGREQSDGGIDVYYRLDESRQNTGELVGALHVDVPEGADSLHLAMTALQEQPETAGYESPLPADVRFVSYEIDNGVLIVNMTGGYTSMSELERTIARACITLTLCSLREVSSLSILVDGATVESGLSLRSIVLPDTSTNAYERKLTMYFPDSSGTCLIEEEHTLTVGQNKIMAEYAMDELIRGPQSEQACGAVPEGTQLLRIEQRHGVCTVDLSAEFYENRPATAAGERLTVYSIVNTLTNVDGVDSVQILVEGERLQSYLYLSLEAPLGASDMLVGPLRPDWGEVQVNVYLPVGEGKFTLVPAAVQRDPDDTLELCAVKYLLSVHGLGSLVNPIPAGTQVNSVQMQGNTCLIDLSSDFTAVGQPAMVSLAAQAITATIVDLGTADYVTITVDGLASGTLERMSKADDMVVE